MLGKHLDLVKEKAPLINNITNFITANDCANILLAVGASPIMADNPKEIEDIISIASGLNINMGVISDSSLEAMFIGGKKANELQKPVLLDPVAAGATKYRTEQANKLLEEVNFSVIRGNISEVKALFLGENSTRGVDAAEEISEDNLNSVVKFAEEAAKKSNAKIFITGKIDVVSDGKKTYAIKNGVAQMAHITGSGCMLSAFLTAFIATENSLESLVAGGCMMGLAGEKALETMQKNNAGNSSYRNYLIDEIYKMTADSLEKGAKYELK